MKPKNVIITGGSRGLGAGIVKSFRNRGHNIFSISRQNCDIANYRDLQMITKYAHENVFHKQHIDIWINNAAVSHGYKEFTQLTYDDITDIVNTNMLGSINGTKVALDIMKHQNVKGHIFNLAGAGSDHSLTPFFSVYGCTKSGISHFTKTIAKEPNTIPENVNLYLISPGMLNTPLLFENLPENLKGLLEVFAEDPTHAAHDIVQLILKKCCNETYYKILEKSHVETLRYFNIKRVLGRIYKKYVCL